MEQVFILNNDKNRLTAWMRTVNVYTSIILFMLWKYLAELSTYSRFSFQTDPFL